MTDVEAPQMPPKRKSVFFSKEDIAQEIPSLPVASLVEELQARHGKTHSEFITAVRDADANDDGLISIPELIVIIENMTTTKKENMSLKKMLMLAMAVLLLVLIAIFGLVFAVVKLTQEVSTGGDSGNENALVNKATGHIVDVHPSDGGGIFLDMAAFTEPVNITFPSYGNTLECVGQVSVEQIDEHYSQFTTGGSEMTIRYMDFAKEGQPVMYTVIPAGNLEVTGHRFDTDAAARAQGATAAIKATQEQFGSPEERKRRLAAATRSLAGADNVDNKSKSNCENGQVPSGVEGLSCEDPAVVPAASASRTEPNEAITIKGPGATRGGSGKTARRLQDGTVIMMDGDVAFADDLLTVGDNMEAFAAQTVDLTFTKDSGLSDDYYFICQAPAVVVAVN